VPRHYRQEVRVVNDKLNMAARWLPWLAAALLAGCGGGGGSSSGNIAGANIPAAVPSPLPASIGLVRDCSGLNCGASSDGSYSGTGIGIWRYTNGNPYPTMLHARLTGVASKTAVLVFTNQSGDAQAMPANSLQSEQASPQMAAATDGPLRLPVPSYIRDFKPSHQGGALAQGSLPKGPAFAKAGDRRSWYSESNASYMATLQLQRTSSDGRQINFWVQDGEWGPGKIDAALLDQIGNRFSTGNNAIYDMVTQIAGKPWGALPAAESGYYIDAAQPLDIVISNLTPDGSPWGLIGYFWGRNNQSSSYQSFSNQSLSLYIDSETLYLGGTTGFDFCVSTLAHELTHMINFYQRNVLLNAPNEAWLEEMTAMGMEDVVDLAINPAYNTIRDDRFPGWLAAGDYNCPVNQYNYVGSCNSYNIGGSFMGFLLRRYGTGFFRSLLGDASSQSDSVAVLDHAIRQAGGTSFADELRRWGTSIALLPASGTPAGYGYPERTEGPFVLPGIDGSQYQYIRNMPASLPATLRPYGHFPLLRANLADTYSEDLNVPAYSSLTIVVQ
jgi:hypothetical protein